MSFYTEALNQYEQEANLFAKFHGLDPSTAHNGAWDAFRHAFVSGAMTRAFGEDIAHIAGDLNEIAGDYQHDQPASEKNMDKWNNAIGRDTGKGATANDEVARRVISAMRQGKLIINPNTDQRIYDNAHPPTVNNSGNYKETPSEPRDWGWTNSEGINEYISEWGIRTNPRTGSTSVGRPRPILLPNSEPINQIQAENLNIQIKETHFAEYTDSKETKQASTFSTIDSLISVMAGMKDSGSAPLSLNPQNVESLQPVYAASLN